MIKMMATILHYMSILLSLYIVLMLVLMMILMIIELLTFILGIQIKRLNKKWRKLKAKNE